MKESRFLRYLEDRETLTDKLVRSISRAYRLYIENPTIKVVKIFSYIPVLWSDEDWDYTFIYSLLAFKLQRMYNREYNTVSEKKLKKELQTVINLCNRIAYGPPDTYNYTKENKATFPHIESASNKLYFEGNELVDKRTNTEAVRSRYSFKREANNEKHYLEYLHKLMARKSSRWWD